MMTATPLLDTSEKQRVHLLEGRGGTYMRLSPSAWTLLKQVEEGHSFQDIARDINASGDTPVTAEAVEAAYQKLRARIEEIEGRGHRLSGAFWLRLELLPSTLVARIAAVGARAYHPAVVVLTLAATLVTAVGVWRGGALTVGGAGFWPGFCLFLLSVLAHELGHASACSRYGARPSEIGLTCYFIYPAFYSDVNAAWGLKRWQRVVIDLGGIYFQLIVGVLYGLLWLTCSWEPLRVAVLFIAGNCLLSLNPLLKFDGYWVLSDALGVTNLSQQARQLLVRLPRRLLGRAKPAPPLPWPGWITGLMGAYAVLSLVFWAWLLALLLPALWRHLQSYGQALRLLGEQLLTQPHLPSGAVLREVSATTYMLLFVLLMVARLARWAWSRTR
jgi:putative peptide zinc metalloprotease protein